jgi:hypothetical protein
VVGLDKMKQQTIIFFMLVTNRDIYLADYAVKSYQKLIPVLKNYNWKLVVYLNCIKDNFKDQYAKIWNKLGYVEIIDNMEFVKIEEFIPGNFVKSEEGWEKIISGKFEPCSVVWTREFRKFKSDYWVTVDADFEILSTDFVVDAFSKFDSNSNLVAVSSDYSDTGYCYDTYSNEYIVLMKRYHTWFCIYKKEVQKCKTSHFYYQEIVHGLRLVFDDTAKLQWDLQEQFGYDMQAVGTQYHRSFIHYGAFSKNNTFDTPRKIRVYRRIAILARRGIFPRDGVFNQIIRTIFRLIHTRIYKKEKIERATLTYYSNLDK